MDFVLSGRSGSFNFGPNEDDFHTVEEVTTYVLNLYGIQDWDRGQFSQNKEAGFLTLNSAKAIKELNWKNKISFTEGLELTVDWYKAAKAGDEMRDFTIKQIEKFQSVRRLCLSFKISSAIGAKLAAIIKATIGNKYLSTEPWSFSPSKYPALIIPTVQI